MHNFKFFFYFLNKNSNKKNIKELKLFRNSSKYFRRAWPSAAANEKAEQVECEEIPCQSKIIYNDFLIKFRKKPEPSNTNDPICLKYLLSDKIPPKENKSEKKTEEHVEANFPYAIKKKYLKEPILDKTVTDLFPDSVINFTPCDSEELAKWSTKSPKINLAELEDPKRWYTDEDEMPNDNIEDEIKFGTSDPNVPISSVPCGGCGALLHCTNASIPGFLPKEVFVGKSNKELLSEICQRCHFLKEFDVALGVNVSASEYPKIISQIKDKKALAILMIDLLDFPCSIWPDINKLIGNKPVIIVGNKIDLFIQEGDWFLQHMKHCLLTSLQEQGIHMKNVKHVALISAKTGFGVEDLISKLHKHWGREGDVYLIGCTNVGKSSLFNALIQSDYCKVKASDLMQRATISSWPGTTLNLIKFPILSPSGWRLHLRSLRLTQQSKDLQAYNEYVRKDLNFRLEQIPLSGYVGSSFTTEEDRIRSMYYNEQDFDGSSVRKKGVDPNDPNFFGKWCYDTPGVVNDDQIVNLLTTPELLLTLPTSMILPRNFLLLPGYTLFIGGLARLDYVSGTKFAWFTVYASKELPVTVTKLEDAELVYENLLGSDILRVPYGGKERLAKWPKLSSKKLEICGIIRQEATADVVLSSAGWVSVALSAAHRCNIEVWTPEGRGIFVRKPPVIKTGHFFRGSKIRGTPAFKTIMKEVKPLSVFNESVYNN